VTAPDRGDALPFEGLVPVALKPDLAAADARQRAAVGSALWAAWGDAVGWISELTDGAGLRRRTKGQPLRGPINWTRKIGGRNGLSVDLPAGTYSDDTQLRLAVCRAYGPDGFDVEAFSAVELTVWPSYALGGGNGTKAAAAAMARPGARWSANRPQNYIDAGGNGAAMRAQPHAWRAPRPVADLLRDVMRDAVVTHGHPSGLLGAALSALAVADSMPGGPGRLATDGTGAWPRLLDDAAMIASVPDDDVEMHDYWLPHWQHPRLGGWRDAVGTSVESAKSEVRSAAAVVDVATGLEDGYREVVEALFLRDPARRGSGLHTMLAALALVTLTHRHGGNTRDALLCAANELDTDTDTIASMAGAVLGCGATDPPSGPLLDRGYIASEAARIAAPGGPGRSPFRYPDLLTWNPPRTQSDALYAHGDRLWVAGLGPASALKPPTNTPSADFAWQWIQLDTSQTLIIKRRITLPPVPHYVAVEPRTVQPQEPARGRENPPVPQTVDSPRDTAMPRQAAPESSGALMVALAKVRDANYDVRVIGFQLARLARDESPTLAAAYGAIVASELAAMRRRD
jgi:ADP-ribosylglycohydrolase